jgi:hypothetical protein
MKKNDIVLVASTIAATSPLVSKFEKNETKSQSPFSNEKVIYVTNNNIEHSTVYVDKPMFKKERKKNNRKVKKRKKSKNGKS